MLRNMFIINIGGVSHPRRRRSCPHYHTFYRVGKVAYDKDDHLSAQAWIAPE